MPPSICIANHPELKVPRTTKEANRIKSPKAKETKEEPSSNKPKGRRKATYYHPQA
jgi:hypothetical protein